jgi:excisionase family DNA binding protein
VSKLLQISKAKVYSLAKSKKIPHIKLEKNIRFVESELVRWVEMQKEPAK